MLIFFSILTFLLIKVHSHQIRQLDDTEGNQGSFIQSYDANIDIQCSSTPLTIYNSHAIFSTNFKTGDDGQYPAPFTTSIFSDFESFTVCNKFEETERRPAYVDWFSDLPETKFYSVEIPISQDSVYIPIKPSDNYAIFTNLISRESISEASQAYQFPNHWILKSSSNYQAKFDYETKSSNMVLSVMTAKTGKFNHHIVGKEAFKISNQMDCCYTVDFDHQFKHPPFVLTNLEMENPSVTENIFHSVNRVLNDKLEVCFTAPSSLSSPVNCNLHFLAYEDVESDDQDTIIKFTLSHNLVFGAQNVLEMVISEASDLIKDILDIEIELGNISCQQKTCTITVEIEGGTEIIHRFKEINSEFTFESIIHSILSRVSPNVIEEIKETLQELVNEMSYGSIDISDLLEELISQIQRFTGIVIYLYNPKSMGPYSLNENKCKLSHEYQLYPHNIEFFETPLQCQNCFTNYDIEFPCNPNYSFGPPLSITHTQGYTCDKDFVSAPPTNPPTDPPTDDDKTDDNGNTSSITNIIQNNSNDDSFFTTANIIFLSVGAAAAIIVVICIYAFYKCAFSSKNYIYIKPKASKDKIVFV